MKTFKFLISIVLLILFEAKGQKIIHEFIPKGNLRDFNAVPIGDSILLSYDQHWAGEIARQFQWITDSTAGLYNIPVNVFEATNSGEEIFLYYLNGKTKDRQLGAVVYDRKAKTRRESSNYLSLPGTVVGSYVNKNLFVILLKDKGKTLSLLEINQLNIVREKEFKLPMNLSSYLNKELSNNVIHNDSEAHSFNGSMLCKIFVRDKIYITLDRRSLNPPWQTTVMALDLNTTEVAVTNFESTPNSIFSSFILDGKLFRTVNSKKKFLLEIFSLETNNLITKSEILPDQPEFPVYYRYGRKNIINEKEQFSRMRKVSPECEPSLVVLKNEGKYFIQWGTYFDDNGFMGPGVASPVGLIKMVVGSLILQLAEGPGVSRYFYYEWDESGNSFQVKEPPVALARKKIDDYEISRNIAYKYKNYIEYKDGIAGVYYNAKDDKVSLVYFE